MRNGQTAKLNDYGYQFNLAKSLIKNRAILDN